jgi:hypothetical protein
MEDEDIDLAAHPRTQGCSQSGKSKHRWPDRHGSAKDIPHGGHGPGCSAGCAAGRRQSCKSKHRAIDRKGVAAVIMIGKIAAVETGIKVSPARLGLKS